MRIKYALIFLSLIFAVAPAWTHPHIFIDYTLTIVFDDDGFAGVRTEWIFDEMFSAASIPNYDVNKDNILDAEEIENIKKKAFVNLQHHNYFLYLVDRGNEIQVHHIENFSASIVGYRLKYSFFIPIRISAKNKKKAITLAFYDESFYVDMLFLDYEPINFEDSEAIKHSHKVVSNYEEGMYYGQGPRTEIWLKFQKN